MFSRVYSAAEHICLGKMYPTCLNFDASFSKISFFFVLLIEYANKLHKNRFKFVAGILQISWSVTLLQAPRQQDKYGSTNNWLFCLSFDVIYKIQNYFEMDVAYLEDVGYILA